MSHEDKIKEYEFVLNRLDSIEANLTALHREITQFQEIAPPEYDGNEKDELGPSYGFWHAYTDFASAIAEARENIQKGLSRLKQG